MLPPLLTQVVILKPDNRKVLLIQKTRILSCLNERNTGYFYILIWLNLIEIPTPLRRCVRGMKKGRTTLKKTRAKRKTRIVNLSRGHRSSFTHKTLSDSRSVQNH